MSKIPYLTVADYVLGGIIGTILGVFIFTGYDLIKNHAEKPQKPEPVPAQEDRRFTTERIWSKGSLIADVMTDKETGRKYILNWNGGVLELNQNKL